MKVVMLGYLGKGTGGVATHTEKVVERISEEQNIELHVITISNEINPEDYDQFNLHIIRNPKIPGLQYLYFPLLIAKKIKELKPDLTHIQGLSSTYSIVAMMLSNHKILLTVHADIVEELKYRSFSLLRLLIRRKLDYFFVKQLIRRSSTVSAVSSIVKNYTRNFTDSEIHIIPNGINLDLFKQQKIQEVRPTLLFIGRLSEIKRIDLLLRAIPKIKNSIPDVRVIIIGEGPEKENLLTLSKHLNIDKNVEFRGFVSESVKIESLYRASLFVLPSGYEGFGIVLMEAMASGKAVVASDSGGIPYVVEDNKTGLLFKDNDLEDLAEKVSYLLSNPELCKKMGEKGRERAQKFSWDNVAKMYLSLYYNHFK